MSARSRRRHRVRGNSVLEDNGVVRCMRCAFGVMTAYLAISLVPLVRWSLAGHSWVPLAVHVLLLGIAATMAMKRRLPSVRLSLDWMPLLAGPFLYTELHWLIQGMGRPNADERVLRWEDRLFPSDPSASLALRFHSVGLSELLHFCYLAYYAIIFVPPLLLWVRRRRSAFAATTLALVIVYTACFAVYIVFPVAGPRFLHGPAAAPDGPVRSLVLAILSAGSSRGTAFPSSHMAAALVAASCALRFQWKLALPIGVLTAGLGVGAVYGGFHYGVDVVAGVAVGLAAVVVARLIEPGRITLLLRSDPGRVKYDVVQERLERRKTAVRDRMRDWRKS